jgi:hypothetical protein
MLVRCKTCGVSSAGTFGRCIACGEEFELTPDEAERRNRELPLRLLETETPKEEVGRVLAVDHGLTQSEVDFAIKDASAIVRRRAKRHGHYLATSGLMLLFGALGVQIVFGGFVIAVGLIAWGFAMLTVGLIKAWTGWNLVSEDEEETTTIESLRDGTLWRLG